MQFLRITLGAVVCLFFASLSMAQKSRIKGVVTDVYGQVVEAATVAIPELNKGAITDSNGYYTLENIKSGTWHLRVSAISYETYFTVVQLDRKDNLSRNITLEKSSELMDEVVVTGTMKAVRKSESPVPVDIISSKLFQKNSTSNVLDALYMVNGVNPQVNCNMCNTSDIGINGMPGSYVMILIDGMPIVSTLSSVYGLSGIPNSIIDRVEIVKGPASALYGSEAIGGVINVITKDAESVPKLFFDMDGSSWGELTGNIGFSSKLSDKVSMMFNINGYYFDMEHDHDGNGYMDKTLQERSSFFTKWDFRQKHHKTASVSLRYYNENRHGGQLGWDKEDRGFVDFIPYNDNPNSSGYNADYVLPNGYTIYNRKYANGFRVPKFTNPAKNQQWLNMVEQVNPDAALTDHMKYQESVYTSRLEIVGKYELPIEENITLQASFNKHDQNSAYGTELFMAHQTTVFGQAYWNRAFGSHDLLLGASYRYIWFKDNTIASENGETPFITQLPGFFLQDLWTLDD
ncbi:MAG TPA: TonB-dependent receptor plug domain-containing protein, partial [Chitinophagaceae bacterium]|nr:TonB-dependent receptor plug domain-containing protein [Chitinophagaceae bacterium]